MLQEIDALVVYLMPGRGQPLPVTVIHGKARPGDLTDMFAKLLGAPELAGSKLTGKGNGRYKLGEAPLLIIDGREADDLDGNVIVTGMDTILTAGLVGAMGKGRCPAITLALEKADASATLWGALAFDEPLGPEGPKSGVFSANLTGDKLVRAEMTLASEEAAIQAEKGIGMWFGPVSAVKRSGATLTVESTRSGDLADLLVPAVQRAIEMANQASCMANLNGIGKGCAMFQAEDKNAKSPESLKVMVDKGLVGPGALRCNSDSRQRACSYFYAPPSPRSAGETLMLCDLEGNHKETRSVGYFSGAVTRMTEAEFQAALKLPRNAKFAAALEKAGG